MSAVAALAAARDRTAQARRGLGGEVEALRRIDRNLRCLADDLDRLGLADRAEFAQSLAARSREVAAFLGR